MDRRHESAFCAPSGARDLLLGPAQGRRSRCAYGIEKRARHPASSRSRVVRMMAAADDEVARMRAELDRLREENEFLKTGEEVDFAPRKHGEECRFLPFFKIESDYTYPRVVPFVGRLGELHEEDVARCQNLYRRFKTSKIMVTAPISAKQEFISLPIDPIGPTLSNPIAIAAPIGTDSQPLDPAADEPDSIVVIERDPEFFEDSGLNVYLWNTADGVQLGWLKDVKDRSSAKCLGEVVVAYNRNLIFQEADDTPMME